MIFKRKLLKPSKRIMPIINSMRKNPEEWKISFDSAKFKTYELEKCYLVDRWEIKRPFWHTFSKNESIILERELNKIKEHLIKKDFQ